MSVLDPSSLIASQIGSDPMNEHFGFAGISECKSVYGRDTIQRLSDELRLACVKFCNKAHDDLEKGYDPQSCADRQTNLICGHMNSSHDNLSRPLKGMGIALSTACFILRSAGDQEAVNLHGKVLSYCERILHFDGAAFAARCSIVGKKNTNVPYYMRDRTLEAVGSTSQLLPLIQTREEIFAAEILPLHREIVDRLNLLLAKD